MKTLGLVTDAPPTDPGLRTLWIDAHACELAREAFGRYMDVGTAEAAAQLLTRRLYVIGYAWADKGVWTHGGAHTLQALGRGAWGHFKVLLAGHVAKK